MYLFFTQAEYIYTIHRLCTCGNCVATTKVKRSHTRRARHGVTVFRTEYGARYMHVGCITEKLYDCTTTTNVCASAFC